MDRFFFFSSRRRHTRSDRDWSSDVCSSDLWLNSTYQGVITARACASVKVCAEAITGIVTTAAATTSWASLFIASSPSGSLLGDPVSDVGRAVEDVDASGLTTVVAGTRSR